MCARMINRDDNVEAVLSHIEKGRPITSEHLHKALRLRATEIAKVLLSHGVEIKKAHWSWVTPYHLAARTGNLVIIEILSKLDARLFDSKDEYGNTPLMLAVKHCFHHVTKHLLAMGANPTITNDQGQSAISLAMNDPTVVQTLENEFPNFLTEVFDKID